MAGRGTDIVLGGRPSEDASESEQNAGEISIMLLLIQEGFILLVLSETNHEGSIISLEGALEGKETLAQLDFICL